jgi:hypothetical protein
VRLHCPEYAQSYAAKYASPPKHAHQRALVLTARKLVRLIDVLLREGKRSMPPAERPNHQGASTPHHARPARQRRRKQAAAVE